MGAEELGKPAGESRSAFSNQGWSGADRARDPKRHKVGPALQRRVCKRDQGNTYGISFLMTPAKHSFYEMSETLFLVPLSPIFSQHIRHHPPPSCIRPLALSSKITDGFRKQHRATNYPNTPDVDLIRITVRVAYLRC